MQSYTGAAVQVFLGMGKGAGADRPCLSVGRSVALAERSVMKSWLNLLRKQTGDLPTTHHYYQIGLFVIPIWFVSVAE